jgi:hypothetical protein
VSWRRSRAAAGPSSRPGAPRARRGVLLQRRGVPAVLRHRLPVAGVAEEGQAARGAGLRATRHARRQGHGPAGPRRGPGPARASPARPPRSPRRCWRCPAST